MLTEDQLDEEGKKLYIFYLSEIRTHYVVTLKKRIKEEAGYLNLDVDGSSIAALLKNMKNKMDEEIVKQSARMSATGSGFNMMDMVKSTHSAKPKALEASAEAFRSKEGRRPAFGGEPWAKICEAFLAIEQAQSSKAIVTSIDLLNSLQHNCCHVLFDLTGTRGGGGSNHTDVKAVLDDKFKAKTPKEFASKMSGDVRSFLKEQGVL
jgi:hypothetical protein